MDQLQNKVPYTLFTGLATSQQSRWPLYQTIEGTDILDRTHDEMFFRTAPFVFHDRGRWRMWYIGGGAWIDVEGKQKPTYELRYLESSDGLAWRGVPVTVMKPRLPQEIGFGRPYIVVDNGRYHMWYSVRSRKNYAIGYATSADGLSWTRDDSAAGIGLGEAGWDSQSISYAAVVRSQRKWLLFYNGNDFGRTGLGVAEMDALPNF